MATESTDLDKLVGPQPEDVVTKKHPLTRGGDPADENSRKGGEAKLPSPPTPFTIKGG